MQQNSSDHRPRTRRLSQLAVATALLPIVATNLAYIVAVWFDTVPACIPYIEGCTSISSTGRTNPSQWIFKPVMLLSAVTMVAFFIACADRAGRHRLRPDSIVVCAVIGGAALVVYLAFLGTEGEVYRTLRRYGVSVYFGFVYLAQLLLARRILRSGGEPLPAKCMLGVSALLLVIGIGSIPITNFVPDKDRIENVIEWDFALLLQLNYLLAWRALARPNPPSRTASD